MLKSAHDLVFRHVHNSNLIYNTAWEDPRLDRQLMKLNRGSRVVMITSAGCNALDYLLNPISLDRFMKAVNKAIDQAGNNSRDAAAPAASDGQEFFFVKADKKLVKVNFDDIVYIEGLKDYVIIRLLQGRVITLQTMKSLEDRLPQDRFKRIHRSYIVAMDKITAIEGNMVEVLEKDKPKLLPIGKNYRDELLDLIEKNRL